ncbi:MAG: hypothetical protein B7Z74_05150 [Deltaproteobacteria bacterium 21-66-5]|nr:MAG: hypothetical protein B7Z74_05150 [Deltaproteobacteria bacterium 21-66-5]
MRSRRIRYVPLRISSSCCETTWSGTWYSRRTREKIEAGDKLVFFGGHAPLAAALAELAKASR